MRYLFLIIVIIQSNNIFSQSENSIVYYINGKVLEEYATIGYRNNVIIRKKKSTSVLDYKWLKRVEIIDPVEKIKRIYEYVYMKNKKRPFLMELLYDGKKVQLYSRKAYMINQPNEPYSVSTSDMAHYGKKKNEQFVKEISLEGMSAIYGNRFKKKGADFFSDCPILVEKIKSKKIKNKNKIKAFEFYDKSCN